MLRMAMTVLPGTRNPHLLVCKFRFLRSGRLVLAMLAMLQLMMFQRDVA
jgi:hypothetical protein